MSGINKAIEYVGKVDRLGDDKRPYDFITKLYRSNDSVHNRISAISKELESLGDKRLAPEHSCQIYLELRNLRHDNWCSYITNNSAIRGFKAIDTEFGAFVKEVLKINDEVPNDICKLTPDILTLSNDERTVYIGDVSVSDAAAAARARKHEKYAPLVDYIKSKNIDVIPVSFIIKPNCSNLNSEVEALRQRGLIDIRDGSLTVYSEYANACNELMNLALEFSDDRKCTQDMIDISDRRSYDTPILPEVPIELSSIIKELTYNPKRSELELMEMIKKETDDKMMDGYFSRNIEDSIYEIDELISKSGLNNHISPKSTLKVVDNSHTNVNKTDLDLLEDYLSDIFLGDDSNERDLLMHLLPNSKQISLMKRGASKKYASKDYKYDNEMKEFKVYGKYQYKMSSDLHSPLVENYKAQIIKGKKEKNGKKAPLCINLSDIESFHSFINHSINYYGSLSNKPPVLDDTWEAATKFEHDTTTHEREAYRYACSTNGAQLCNSMALLYDRLTHLSTSLSTKDNIFIPPNGSFIAIIPHNHAPVTSKNVDVPFIFITRCNKAENLSHIESEYSFNGNNYTYFVSKLCRMNIDKIQNWSNAAYKLIATSTYLLTKCSSMSYRKEKVIGTLTYFILDVHQKTSEYLDLFKYISFMPFADISRLPALIKDKLDLLMKTRLDAWMLFQLKRFIKELGDTEKLDAVKPMLKTFNSGVVSSSLGIRMSLPSFCDPSVRHKMPEEFIEEISVMNTVRPKHLYGSQFMDKSITQTCEWNLEYEKEVEKHGDWAVGGCGEGVFPFDAKFCYSSDAIYYAEKALQNKYTISKGRVMQDLGSSVYSGFLHKNCSLRGCTKDKSDRSNSNDIHTTSLEACLNRYKESDYVDSECTVISIGIKHLIDNETQQYSMSEKDQRGGGRPIATPTIGTKAALMLIEKPEMSKGKQMPNNIIVPGKNKLREQCETYKEAISRGTGKGFKMVFQLTEDQTKYSENDNHRKYLTYIKCNSSLDPSIKALQYHVINGLTNREHLIKRLPKSVLENEELRKYIVRDNTSLGVKAIIGWPQGMLNFISTNIHCAADVWITEAYNTMYPMHRVYTKGLVHSDDSWVVVCCNSVKDFERFSIFRMLAKKMFCLKLNEKKLWGSKYLGELVSNYNLNGNVHLSVGKTLANSFNNLCFQNWPIDVHNQISSLQQCYRNGATLGVIIMLHTLLKQQIIKTYNVKGLQLDHLTDLPIELGGFPGNSAFQLAVTGVSCHYKHLLDKCRTQDSFTYKVISHCLRWSIEKARDENRLASDRISIVGTILETGNNTRDKYYEMVLKDKETLSWDDDDFEDLSLPDRGNVFSAIHHILPKSKKLSMTLKAIKELKAKFPSNGLEKIVTRVDDLKESLGHLCALASGMIYELAADRYSNSQRRMAISQSMQSSGKVVRIYKLCPMTFNELLQFISLSTDSSRIDISVIENAFSDNDDLVGLSYDVVHHSCHEISDSDKRKVITKMPFVENKFRTIGKLQDVLLYTIDQHLKTNYLATHSKPNVSYDTLKQDMKSIRENFRCYFVFYPVREACSLIAQQYYSSIKSRLWTQPHLRCDNMLNFLADLYGKTANVDHNYKMYITTSTHCGKSRDKDKVRTIYFTEVLNRLYEGKFKMLELGGASVDDVLRTINVTRLGEDEMLKYAVLMYTRFNNTDILERLRQSQHYTQRYIKAQERYGGAYVGPFEAICKMNNVVVKIIGKPGNLELVSNCNDVMGIMTIMRKFVLNNFHSHRYESPGCWGDKHFWRSEKDWSEYYLNYHSRVSTTIASHRGPIALPIKIDSDLSYGSAPTLPVISGFTVDEYLRRVSYVCKGESTTFTSIRQNFGLPLKDEVVLEPELLEGFNCRELYATGAVENLVTRSMHSVSIDVLRRLLAGTDTGITCLPVCEMLLHMINKHFRTGSRYEQELREEATVVVDMEIQGCDIAQLQRIEEMTTPENLESIAMEYVGIEEHRSGPLYKMADIRKALCKSLTGKVTDFKIDSFIYHLIRSRIGHDFFMYMRKSIDDGSMTIEDISAYLSDEKSKPCSLQTYCFIMASDLNMAKLWDDIDLERYREKRYTIDSSELMCLMIAEVENIIKDIWCIEREEEPTILDVV
ncbi:RNA-dependent RNA polymerase [Anopheles triannulatus orthophasmavirus]|uniref:RNA-directed RNA polymerase L n=2 Tax=root TaxID=1 RepID=A0A481XWF3_9VIRU|nr:RNA-dependent RNA polymerase [Anopheles triannulatus orthophasmavirus]QBK47217.1 RNA-dependent RNA polymerase [Anopheles triannulatus orthophasmavirus]